MRKELTFDDYWSDEPRKAYKTRKAALLALFQGEKDRMARDQESFCFSCWNKVEAGVMTDARAKEKIKGYKKETKEILARIKTRLADYF